MAFLKALGKFGRAAVGTVILPVDAVKDFVTLGGSIIDEESAIVKRAKKIAKNVGEAIEEIDEE